MKNGQREEGASREESQLRELEHQIFGDVVRTNMITMTFLNYLLH